MHRYMISALLYTNEHKKMKQKIWLEVREIQNQDITCFTWSSHFFSLLWNMELKFWLSTVYLFTVYHCSVARFSRFANASTCKTFTNILILRTNLIRPRLVLCGYNIIIIFRDFFALSVCSSHKMTPVHLLRLSRLKFGVFKKVLLNSITDIFWHFFVVFHHKI